MPDEMKMEKVDEDDGTELFVQITAFPETGVPRFDFQRGAVHASKGFVINAGCNEDPAGLKSMEPSRVINVDLHAYDEGMKRPNLVDKIMDITDIDAWSREFARNSAEIVVFGDVLEHLSPEAMEIALSAAVRVAPRLCITIPEDHRIDPHARYVEGIYNQHVTVATEEVMRRVLSNSGWKPFVWIKDVLWGFNDEAGRPVLGHCIEAHRV